MAKSEKLDADTFPATKRQMQILKFLDSTRDPDRCYASYRDVGLRFGMAPNGVRSHLNALKKKGYIKGGEGLSRSIVLTKKAKSSLGRK